MKEIPVGKGRVALVDDADYERVSAYRWCFNRGYALNNTVGRMHVFIMQPPPGMVVHHRNANGLDNRRSELEVLTPSEHLRRHGSPELRGRRRDAGGWVRRTVEGPVALMEEIERLADESGRSVNREMVRAMEYWCRLHGENGEEKFPK